MRALSVGLIASLALAAPVQAGTPQSVSIRIPYADLDLSTSTGVATFRQRSVKAIRSACSELAGEFISARSSEQRCRADALAQAMTQIEEKRRTTLALLTMPTA